MAIFSSLTRSAIFFAPNFNRVFLQTVHNYSQARPTSALLPVRPWRAELSDLVPSPGTDLRVWDCSSRKAGHSALIFPNRRRGAPSDSGVFRLDHVLFLQPSSARPHAATLSANCGTPTGMVQEKSTEPVPRKWRSWEGNLINQVHPLWFTHLQGQH